MCSHCPHCKVPSKDPSGIRNISRFGKFRRSSDGQLIQRFWCKRCKRHFSRATFHVFYREKKRHKNFMIAKLLSGAVSQRETARIMNVNRKTVDRKLLTLGEYYKDKLTAFNLSKPLTTEVQFDELETHEHTKLKPLSVAVCVETQTRRILDLEVSQMPARGKLAQKSREKHGPRRDLRSQGRQKMLRRLTKLISPTAHFKSDSNPHYPKDLKKIFPEAKHSTVLGQRGAITGQGEIKKTVFDPLFSLNHTMAMFRAHVARLLRRTWNTTKKAKNLDYHMAIFAYFHNIRIEQALNKRH